MSEPILVSIYYCKKLQKITGKSREFVVTSKNIPFLFFLNIIFTSYPLIMQTYPPGTIGLLLNGCPPQDYSLLENNDVVKLIVTDIYKKC